MRSKRRKGPTLSLLHFDKNSMRINPSFLTDSAPFRRAKAVVCAFGTIITQVNISRRRYIGFEDDFVLFTAGVIVPVQVSTLACPEREGGFCVAKDGRVHHFNRIA